MRESEKKSLRVRSVSNAAHFARKNAVFDLVFFVVVVVVFSVFLVEGQQCLRQLLPSFRFHRLVNLLSRYPNEMRYVSSHRKKKTRKKNTKYFVKLIMFNLMAR